MLASSGCERPEASQMLVSPTPNASQTIPLDWKRIDKIQFTLNLPPDVKEKKVRGIDTEVWEFEGKQITLSVEAGFLGGGFDFVKNQYESTIEERTIAGEKADYLSLDLNKPVLRNWTFNADGSTRVQKEEKNLVVGVYFPNREIKFWIARTPGVPLDVAEKIISSITLKQLEVQTDK
jgi:hypothetical protein